MPAFEDEPGLTAEPADTRTYLIREEVRAQASRDLTTAIRTAEAARFLLENSAGYSAPSLLMDIAAIEAILKRLRRSVEGSFPVPQGGKDISEEGLGAWLCLRTIGRASRIA